MRRRRRLTGTLCAGVLALVFATGAAAATPQQIYKDLADNNRLDRRYSYDDLQRALAGDFRRSLRDHRANQPGRVPSALPPADSDGGRGALPFTGLDVALLTAGGGPLLLLGVALRRRLMLEQAAARRHDFTAA